MGRKTQIKCNGDDSRFEEVASFVSEQIIYYANQYNVDLSLVAELLTKLLEFFLHNSN